MSNVLTRVCEELWGAEDAISRGWTHIVNKKLLSLFPWEILGYNKGELFLPLIEHSQCKENKQSCGSLLAQLFFLSVLLYGKEHVLKHNRNYSVLCLCELLNKHSKQWRLLYKVLFLFLAFARGSSPLQTVAVSTERKVNML